MQPISTKEQKRRAEQSRRAEQEQRDRVLRAAEVRARVGLSRTTIWRLIKGGRFPKPVKLTEVAIGWRESAIDAWIEARS